MEDGWRRTGETAGAKVLIVDDNAGIRRALTFLLDVNGFGSLSVAGPEEALEAIATQDIGVVIQDMNYSEDTTGGGAKGSASSARFKLGIRICRSCS